MTAHLPPVPPANRSDKGPGEPANTAKGDTSKLHPGKAPANADQQDWPGNSKINTTHPGYQQDR